MPGTGPVVEKGMRGLVARAFSLTEDAVYVVVGGKDGYVGRDGKLPPDETSRFGDDAPPGA